MEIKTHLTNLKFNPSSLKLSTISCNSYLDTKINIDMIIDNLELDDTIIALKFNDRIKGPYVSKTYKQRKNKKHKISSRKKKRKDFSNQCTMIMRFPIGVDDDDETIYNNVNVKVFRNGKIVVTGARTITLIHDITKTVYEKICRISGFIEYEIPQTLSAISTTFQSSKDTISKYDELIKMMTKFLTPYKLPTHLNFLKNIPTDENSIERVQYFFFLFIVFKYYDFYTDYNKIMLHVQHKKKEHGLNVLLNHILGKWTNDFKISGVFPITNMKHDDIKCEYSRISSIITNGSLGFMMNMYKLNSILNEKYTKRIVNDVETDSSIYQPTGYTAIYLICRYEKEINISIYSNGKLKITNCITINQLEKIYDYILYIMNEEYDEIYESEWHEKKVEKIINGVVDIRENAIYINKNVIR